MTIDNDDALLDALSRGEPAPEGDTVASLLAAWHSEISDISPTALRPAAMPSPGPTPQPRRRNRTAGDRADGRTPTVFLPSPESIGPDDPPDLQPTSAAGGAAGAGPSLPRRGAEPSGVRPPGGGPERGPRRGSRPLIVAIAVAVLAFGGVAAASATAEPGTPLWPIARIVWGDRADSKIAEQEAQRLLGDARKAVAGNRSQEAVDLVTAAQKAIDRVTNPAMKLRLQEEAEEILAQARGLVIGGVPAPGQTGQPGATPLPGQTAPPAPGASPTPEKTGLLPPILPSLPSLLPSLPLLG